MRELPTHSRCVILRGIPGAGKSTLCESLVADGLHNFVVSADAYFVRDGRYEFDPKKLGEAHGECLRQFAAACLAGSAGSRLIVDNTNVNAIEIAPYYALGVAYGLQPTIVTIVADPAKAAARNRHGVPAHVIASKHDRLLREERFFPHYWTHVHVPAVYE